MTKNNKQRGFTIIEVALVLAVAALIFLVVFLAVPALQRNQRNDAIKRDIAFVAEAVTSYVSNNNALPDGSTVGAGASWMTNHTVSGTTGLSNYLKDGISTNTQVIKTETAASTTAITGTAGTTWAAAPTGSDTIIVYNNAKCGTAPALKIVAGNSRQAAVVGATEVSANTFEYYCQSI